MNLQEKKRHPDFGFVYLIHAEGSERYKIGFTKRLPGVRLKELKSGSPFPLKLVAEYETFEGQSSERYWHEKFKAQRVFNEWFELSQGDIDTFTETAGGVK